MADKRTLYSIKNTQDGPRGLWSGDVLTFIDGKDEAGNPGSALATLTDDEKAAADSTGYFEFSDPTDEQKKAVGIVDAPKPKPAPANS